MLRKRIQELQTYRRLGLRSAGDIEKYDADLAKKVHPAPVFPESDSPDFPSRGAREGDCGARLHLRTDPAQWIRTPVFRHGPQRVGGTRIHTKTGRSNERCSRPKTWCVKYKKTRLPHFPFEDMRHPSDMFHFALLAFQRRLSIWQIAQCSTCSDPTNRLYAPLCGFCRNLIS
jgi:hypothetical protein